MMNNNYQPYFSVADHLQLSLHPEAPTPIPTPNAGSYQQLSQAAVQQKQLQLLQQYQQQQQQQQTLTQQAPVQQLLQPQSSNSLPPKLPPLSPQTPLPLSPQTPLPLPIAQGAYPYPHPYPQQHPQQSTPSMNTFSSGNNIGNGVDNLDLSNFDAETLLTLKETLATLEHLGSPNFTPTPIPTPAPTSGIPPTPEMLLKLAQQNALLNQHSPRTPFQIEQSSILAAQQKQIQQQRGILPYSVFPHGAGFLGNEQGQIMIPKLDLTKLDLMNLQKSGIIQSGELSARSDDSSLVKFRSKREKKLYKTELCLLWSEKGQCEFGDSCKYAHGDEELKEVRRHPRFKTEVCRHYTETGTCPFGRRCHFLHPVNGDISARIPLSDSTSNSGSISPKRLPVFEFLANGETIEQE